MYERLSPWILGAFLAWVLGYGAWYGLSEPMCVIGVATDAITGDKRTWCFEFWLNRYQTGIAAILALLAAGVSVYFLRQQIAQDRLHEEERYAREHAAARAVLQLTLADVCEYAKRSVLLQSDVIRQFDKPEDDDRDWSWLKTLDVPAQPIDQLRQFIASTEAKNSAIVSDLIQKLQVHEGRTRTDIEQLKNPQNGGFIVIRPHVIEHILDATEIYARAAMLFDYARRRTEAFPGPPQLRNMSNAAFNISPVLTDNREFVALLERRFPHEET